MNFMIYFFSSNYFFHSLFCTSFALAHTQTKKKLLAEFRPLQSNLQLNSSSWPKRALNCTQTNYPPAHTGRLENGFSGSWEIYYPPEMPLSFHGEMIDDFRPATTGLQQTSFNPHQLIHNEVRTQPLVSSANSRTRRRTPQHFRGDACNHFQCQFDANWSAFRQKRRKKCCATTGCLTTRRDVARQPRMVAFERSKQRVSAHSWEGDQKRVISFGWSGGVGGEEMVLLEIINEDGSTRGMRWEAE